MARADVDARDDEVLVGEDEASDVVVRGVVVRGVVVRGVVVRGVVVRGVVVGAAVTRVVGTTIAGIGHTVRRTVGRRDAEAGRDGVATTVVGTSKPGTSPPGAGRPGTSPFPVVGTATIGPLLVWDSPIRTTAT